MTKISAPFTPDQIRHLNNWQRHGRVHPFTCAGPRSDLAHVEYARKSGDQDMGVLIAEKSGWRCPVCNYRQDWAHDFMAIPIEPGPFDPPQKQRRGFAVMHPDKRREIAIKGGSSVPNEKRSFARDKELAITAGRAGGKASKGGGRGKR